MRRYGRKWAKMGENPNCPLWFLLVLLYWNLYMRQDCGPAGACTKTPEMAGDPPNNKECRRQYVDFVPEVNKDHPRYSRCCHDTGLYFWGAKVVVGMEEE